MTHEIAPDRKSLGEAAGKAIAEAIRERISATGSVSVVFASAPSQNEALASLAVAEGIEWDRVTAFHLDEYVGAAAGMPYSFRRYLEDRLFFRSRPKLFHGIRGEAVDLQAECARYSELLRQAPPDLAVLGIGENGHLAFNDPPCDFQDPKGVKVVELTEACRVQQVHDGAFASLDAVPKHAFTLTVPAILSIPRLFVVVPGALKAEAVKRTLEGPISPECPASILRMHPRARLYLDVESASGLTTPEKATPARWSC